MESTIHLTPSHLLLLDHSGSLRLWPLRKLVLNYFDSLYQGYSLPS